MPNIRFQQAVEIKAPTDLIQTWQRFQQFSMTPREHFVENLQLIQQLGCRLDGAFVECGTWKGGMAAAMMVVGGDNRQYHFFDSFEGLPPAQQIDGEAALRYQRNVDAPDYHDNCTASYDEFMALMATVSSSSANLHVHKGWFADTVPRYDGPDIAVLRLDGDWYESTMTCLTHLYPRVQTGGVVILDDYDAWTGCSRAVHQYLTDNQSASVINRTAFAKVAYLIKDEVSSQVAAAGPAVAGHSVRVTDPEKDARAREIHARVGDSRSRKDVPIVSTKSQTLHPTIFEQDLDGQIKVKRIQDTFPLGSKDADADERDSQYPHDWWVTEGCPLAFKYFDIDSLYASNRASTPGQGPVTADIAKNLYGYMQDVYRALRGRAFASVLELGAGGGEFTAVFRDAGLDYVAVEGSQQGGRRLLERGIPPDRVIAVDLRKMQPLDRTFDLVVCTDVIEHVEPFFASKIIELCTAHADTVWFSAADRRRPAQIHHMNEQAIEVWDNIFAFLGFSISLELDNRFERASRLYLRAAAPGEQLPGVTDPAKSAPPHSYPLLANESGPAHVHAGMVNPAPLSSVHVRNCQMLASREELLERLPKGGVVAEIGVNTGRFSELIYSTTRPREMALFDLTDRNIRFPIRERPGVRFFAGDSSTNLQAHFPDEHFDFIYIDGDHSLEGIWRDILVARRKVKANGLLVFDDYLLFSHYENFLPYGAIQCVNHLCVTDNWELVFYSFRSDYTGYDNVAIRRIGAADRDE